MTKRLSKNKIDLQSYPRITTEVSDHICIGDLHANALKLLHLLIQEGIFRVSEKDYENFLRIYYIPPELIGESEILELLDFFDHIEVINTKTFICLIGDEKADRGSNDFYVDLILVKLNEAGCPFEILLSNHGALSIEKMECFVSGEDYYNSTYDDELEQLIAEEEDIQLKVNQICQLLTEQHALISHVPSLKQLYDLHHLRLDFYIKSQDSTLNYSDEEVEDFKIQTLLFNENYQKHTQKNLFLPGLPQLHLICEQHAKISRELVINKNKQLRLVTLIAQRVSFKNLNILINRNILNMTSIKTVYDMHYSSHLKLLSYRIDPVHQVFSIFSHAPCGLNTIVELGHLFSILVDTSSVFRLAQSIDAINQHFQTEYVKKYHVHQLLNASESLLHQFIWNREYTLINRPTCIQSYQLHFVHGHDSSEMHRPLNVFNLDSNLGGMNMIQGVPSPIDSGEDLVLKTSHEFTLEGLMQFHQQNLKEQLGLSNLPLSMLGFDAYQARAINLSELLEEYTEEVKTILALIPQEIFKNQLKAFENLLKIDAEIQMFLKKFSIFRNSSSLRKLEELQTFAEQYLSPSASPVCTLSSIL